VLSNTKEKQKKKKARSELFKKRQYYEGPDDVLGKNSLWTTTQSSSGTTHLIIIRRHWYSGEIVRAHIIPSELLCVDYLVDLIRVLRAGFACIWKTRKFHPTMFRGEF
jgi:hypothetical protein